MLATVKDALSARRCARRHERGAGRNDGMAALIEQQDDCLDWSAVLGGLGGGRRLLRSEREGVYGVVTVIGTRVGALLTQQRLQLVAVERPDLVRKSSISSNTAGASSGVQVRGISTVSGRRCAGSVIVSGGLVMTWRRGAGGSVARCGRGLL